MIMRNLGSRKRHSFLAQGMKMLGNRNKMVTKLRRSVIPIAILICFFLTFFYFTTYWPPTTFNSVSINSNTRPFKSFVTSDSNIFFLKVHKCASSTVQNILMRYGHTHRLNFALPYTGNYLGHPQTFHPDMALPLLQTHFYNVLCHHCRFNESDVSHILPSATSVHVAIVRDPVYLFESIFEYYDLSVHYGMTLEEFLNMPMWWYSSCLRSEGRIGINQIAFDFGIEEKDFTNVLKFGAYVKQLDGIFDLVMIAEYFEESIVLLKHLMNLDYKDAVYIALNERIAERKVNITRKMADRLRQINHVDQFIYEHFLKVFRERVRRFGERKMAEEVAELRRQNDYWTKFCGFRKVPNSSNLDPLFTPYRSEKLQTIELENRAKSQNMCKYLALPEIQFTNELRKTHIEKHASAWNRLLYFIGYYKY